MFQTARFKTHFSFIFSLTSGVSTDSLFLLENNMDKVLEAFLCGFITGASCFCVPAIYANNDEATSRWSSVGYLFGVISGFSLLIFGISRLVK